DFEGLLNLRRQQVSVLIADFRGASFQMDKGPAVVSGPAEGVLQPCVGLWRSRNQRQENSCQTQGCEGNENSAHNSDNSPPDAHHDPPGSRSGLPGSRNVGDRFGG